MALTVNYLSAFTPDEYELDLNSLSLNQINRQFPGDYNFNFVDILKNAVSMHVQNYDNFYLSDKVKLTNVITVEPHDLERLQIYTYLKSGSKYLNFVKEIDPRPFYDMESYFVPDYAYYTFNDNPESQFIIDIKNKDYCTISYYDVDAGELYYLVENCGNVFFIHPKLIDLNITNTNAPHLFNYMLDRNYKFLYLYIKKKEGSFIIETIGDKLVATTNIDNVTPDYIITRFFEIESDDKVEMVPKINTSFATYSPDSFLIDGNNTMLNLESNYLFFKPGYVEDSSVSLINLKNQVSRLGAHIAGNSLLSAFNETDNLTVADQREYTSILNGKTDVLELNYVFYNQDILINPGTNYFTAPSSIEPFDVLNINDTTFANCGAYAFEVPIFADKVYCLDANMPATQEQHYLCTWLSGSPMTENKVWMDRYYYPDRITKYNALISQEVFGATYTSEIEQMVLNNMGIQVIKPQVSFFDVVSMLEITPNKRYVYERATQRDVIEPSIIYCEQEDRKNINFYKQINKSGKFTLGFNFTTNEDVFSILSIANEKGYGLTIVKNFNILNVILKLYDNSLDTIQTISKSYTLSKYNIHTFVLGFNALTGKMVILINNASSKDEIEFDIVKYVDKRLFSGDFYFEHQGEVTDLIQYTSNPKYEFLQNIYLIAQTYTPNILTGLMFKIANKEVEPIYITIPCGQRNATDEIVIYNNLTLNTKAKSNHININIKNANLIPTVQEDVTNTITSILYNILPVTNKVNEIKYLNFKHE